MELGRVVSHNARLDCHHDRASTWLSRESVFRRASLLELGGTLVIVQQEPTPAAATTAAVLPSGLAALRFSQRIHRP
jgi:hypothetical protein